jgi:hypothetical protein
MCQVVIKDGIEYCEATGLPITEVINEVGEFCERMCGFDAHLFSLLQTARMLDDMGPIFKREIDNE